jgi:hypothetical protein
MSYEAVTRCRRIFAALLLLILSSAAMAATRHELRMGEQRLEITISTGFTPAMQGTLLTWVEFVSDALAGVYGHWPRGHWRVLIEPLPSSGDDPIPWAQVRRGQVDSIDFYIVPEADGDKLIRAWTGYHEMAHLLIPYRGWGDTWFSEGLASYYQNLLQARTGIISERVMWQKLYAGFVRGQRNDRYDGQTLARVSDEMRSNRAYMRVYWSGAWYFLNTDIQLRRKSGGKMSLDRALGKLNACCADQPLSARQIARKLDQLNDLDLFEPLFDETRDSTSMPEFETLFHDLAIEISAERVSLRNGTEAARLRSGMTAASEM